MAGEDWGGVCCLLEVASPGGVSRERVRVLTRTQVFSFLSFLGPLVPRRQHLRHLPHWLSHVQFPNPAICGFLEASFKMSGAYSNGDKGPAGPISLGHDLSLWENSAPTNHGWNKEVFLFVCPAFPFFF